MSEKISGKIKAGSAKAFLFEFEFNGKQYEEWVPKGQLEFPRNYTIDVCLSDYICWKKGLITEEEFKQRQADGKGRYPKKEDNCPF